VQHTKHCARADLTWAAPNACQVCAAYLVIMLVVMRNRRTYLAWRHSAMTIFRMLLVGRLSCTALATAWPN
jgi:hypothetical protein